MFTPGMLVCHVTDPSKIGTITGQVRARSPHALWEVTFSHGETKFVSAVYLKAVSTDKKSAMQLLKDREFGRPHDLRRRMTFEKLKGTLSEFIYSMDAAEIDFLPYQYKPVLKFIESPTERLLIADEVGLGKTIEAALVWQELLARRDARRLIIFCPKTLANNWKNELRSKFMIQAEICSVEVLASHLREVESRGASVRFALIATYSSVRGSREDFQALDDVKTLPEEFSTMGQMMKSWRDWEHEFNFADLLILDEAHILRNSASLASKTCALLANASSGVLCVSATPINNKSTDLLSLLKLLDGDTFQTQEVFDALLVENEPVVRLSNALMQTPPLLDQAEAVIPSLRSSSYVGESKLIDFLSNTLADIRKVQGRSEGDLHRKSELLNDAQRIAEQLNLLANYVTRTRRRQVEEVRAIRRPLVVRVDFTPMERAFYDAVTRAVKNRVKREGKRFSIFHLISPQLRMASCIPALVDAYRSSDVDAFLENVIEGSSEDFEHEEKVDQVTEMLSLVNQFRDYDFAANDTKYQALKLLLSDKLKDDGKIVLFAYYRATLEYLHNRLERDGITSILLHGGINGSDERTAIIDEFRDERGPRVLLSSEVGAEGINLQFSRVVINYDLPWNPMRVEQRIGRIDRVGQTASTLDIVHFRAADTVEDRVFELLYEKIDQARLSLGDMEDILGKEVADLSLELFSKDLSKDEQDKLIETKASVIINKSRLNDQLDQNAGVFEGLSDFLRSQINRNRKLGRYVTSDELRNFIDDFFRLNAVGNVLEWDYKAPGVFRLEMNYETYRRFSDFTRATQSVMTLAQTGQVIVGTLKNEIAKTARIDRRKVPLITHLSPLVRWITSELSQDNLYSACALTFKTDKLPPGVYGYALERWNFKGTRISEVLSYGIVNLASRKVVLGEEAEAVFLDLVRDGESWVNPDIDVSTIDPAFETLIEGIQEEFGRFEARFEAENQNATMMQEAQVRSHFERKIASDEGRLRTAEASGNANSIRFARALLSKTEKLYDMKMDKINSARSSGLVESDISEITRGVFRILS